MVSVEHIQRTVAHHFGISLSELKSKRRDPVFSHPRMIAMYMCRVHLKLSFPKIGKAFGRDHTTAIHAIERVITIIDTNDAFVEQHLDPLNEQIRRIQSYA